MENEEGWCPLLDEGSPPACHYRARYNTIDLYTVLDAADKPELFDIVTLAFDGREQPHLFSYVKAAPSKIDNIATRAQMRGHFYECCLEAIKGEPVCERRTGKPMPEMSADLFGNEAVASLVVTDQS